MSLDIVVQGWVCVLPYVGVLTTIDLSKYQIAIIESLRGGMESVQNGSQSNEDHWRSSVDKINHRCSF